MFFNSPQAAGAYYARKKNRATELVDDNFSPAWGTITFLESPIPSSGQTITINGTVLTFGTTISLVGLTTLAEVLAATIAYVGAHPINGANVSGSGDGLLVLSSKPADTSVTLSASNATVSHATLQKQQVRARVPL